MKVFVNSLPKSGTHLLGRFCELVNLNKDGLHVSGSLLRKSPYNFIRNFKIAKIKDADGIEVDLDIPSHKVSEKWFRKTLKNLPNNSFFYGHAPFSNKLSSIFKEEGIKVLYIHREPKDVIVSLSNHFIKFPNYPFHEEFSKLKSVKDRIILSMNGIEKGAAKLAPFHERLQRTQGWQSDENVFSLTFEELIGPNGGGDSKVQKSTIEEMTTYLEIEETNIDEIINKIFYKKAITFNKGTINQWRNIFDEDLLKIYEEKVINFLQ